MSTPPLFKKFDHVRFIGKSSTLMLHGLNEPPEAIILYTYAEKYGGSMTRPSYGIFVKDFGEICWFDDTDFTLIAGNQESLLKAWEESIEKERAKFSDLDWIFANGFEVWTNPLGPTATRLARDLGINNLYGRRGEGITWLKNACSVLQIAFPYLLTGDKVGWTTTSGLIRKEFESGQDESPTLKLAQTHFGTTLDSLLGCIKAFEEVAHTRECALVVSLNARKAEISERGGSDLELSACNCRGEKHV